MLYLQGDAQYIMKRKLGTITFVTLTFIVSMFLRLPPAGIENELALIAEPARKATIEKKTADPFEGYDDLTISIVSVLEKKETGGSLGCIDKKGGSGEIGCFQFMPETWAAYSRQVFGSVRDMTPENEMKVVLSKVSEWLDTGMTPEQVFLTWQQGNSSHCKSGVNGYGIAFDSCAYVADAMQKLATISE